MTKNAKESGWWSRWFSRATFLSLLSAIAVALYMTNDNYVMHNVIVGSSKNGALMVCLLIGSWLGVLLSIPNNALFGKKIEPRYPGMSFASKKTQLMAVGAGLAGFLSTAFYLKASQDLDSSIVVALAKISMVYLIAYDAFRGNIDWRRVWPPFLAVFAGSFLAGITEIEFSIEAFSLGAFLLLVVGSSGATAVGEIFEQEGARDSDGVTLSFWRMFWFAVWSALLAPIGAWILGCWDEFVSILTSHFWVAIPWLFLSLFIAYFGNNLRNTAKRYEAVSIISIVLSLSVVLGIPLALIVGHISPGALGELPNDTGVWITRGVGALLLFWGIYQIRKHRETISKPTF